MSERMNQPGVRQSPEQAVYYSRGADIARLETEVDRERALHELQHEAARKVGRDFVPDFEVSQLEAERSAAQANSNHQQAIDTDDEIQRRRAEYERRSRERDDVDGVERTYFELRDAEANATARFKAVESDTSQISPVPAFVSLIIAAMVALVEASIQVLGGSLASLDKSAADIALTVGLAGFVLSLAAHQIGHAHTHAHGEKPRASDRWIAHWGLRIGLALVLVFSLYQTETLWYFLDIPRALVRDWPVFLAHIDVLPGTLQDLAVYLLANYLLFFIAWMIGKRLTDSRPDYRRVKRDAARARVAAERATKRRDMENLECETEHRDKTRQLEANRRVSLEAAARSQRQAATHRARAESLRQEARAKFSKLWSAALAGFSDSLETEENEHPAFLADTLTGDEIWTLIRGESINHRLRPSAYAGYVRLSGLFVTSVVSLVAVIASAALGKNSAHAVTAWPCSNDHSRLVFILDESDARDDQDRALLDQTILRAEQALKRWQRISVWRTGPTAGRAEILLDTCAPPPCPSSVSELFAGGLDGLTCAESVRDPQIARFQAEFSNAFEDYRRNERYDQRSPLVQTIDRALNSYASDGSPPVVIVFSDGLENSQAFPWRQRCICDPDNADAIWAQAQALDLFQPAPGAVLHFVGPGRHMGGQAGRSRELSPAQYQSVRQFWAQWLDARQAQLGFFGAGVPAGPYAVETAQ